MTPLDAMVGALLFLLCAHVGTLFVALVRGALPQRRHPDRRLALLAGGAALAGELLALRGLLGRPPPVAWVAGLLLVGVLLGILARGVWREHPAGRAAFHAVLAAPIVLAFVVALALR